MARSSHTGTAQPRRSVWAWGAESQEPGEDALAAAARELSLQYGLDLKPAAPVAPGDLKLRKPRLRPDGAIRQFSSTTDYDRAFHTFGHSFPDRVRKFHGEFANPPDVVLFPSDESEATAALDWAYSQAAVIIPFGGGSSVVGGVEPPEDAERVVTIDLGRLSGVLEVDPVSRAARIQGGTYGPAIESALRPHGLTLRHFPQSFEYSTLGGWIATRSAGHYATNHTHIDDLVESVRMLTPNGTWESRRLPGSGAGPAPDRIVLGSEGTLGLVTEAWMRVQGRPRFREGAGVIYTGFGPAAEAARRIVQAKLWPANCRVLDPGEAAAHAGLNGAHSLLVLGFESSDLPQEAPMRAALEIAVDCGGKVIERAGTGSGDRAARDQDVGPVERWRRAFIEMPYRWNTLLGVGLINDTFETAITWDRWPEFDETVRESVGRALQEVCGGGTITCRFTHVYTDGPAPYYSFTGMGRSGGEIEMWAEIKAAASAAVIEGGGTITHHHAVGRVHRPDYDRERPELFAGAMAAIKRTVDPAGLLNPGVLIDPLQSPRQGA